MPPLAVPSVSDSFVPRTRIHTSEMKTPATCLRRLNTFSRVQSVFAYRLRFQVSSDLSSSQSNFRCKRKKLRKLHFGSATLAASPISII